MKRITFYALTVMFLISVPGGFVHAKGTFQGYWEQTTTAKSTMQGQPANTTENQTVYFKSGMMKTVNRQKGEEIILRLDLGLIWTVNTKTKSYTEVKFSDMEAKMNSVKKQMAESMKNMTPEQRKMMENMMGGRLGSMMGDNAGPAITFKKTNETKNVNGYECKKVDMLMNNKPMVTMWMTDKYDLGSDFVETYQRMGLIKGKFTDDVKNMRGFPMLTEVTMETSFGQVENTTTVTKVVKKSLADKEFELPKGLRKNELPQMNFH